MEVTNTAILGVLIFKPKRFADSRGYFVETYTKTKFDSHMPGFTFVQDNESFSKDAYTVRGLHFQAPPHAQDKLVRVVKGAILDIVVDIRTGSPSFGQSVSAELTAENGEQLLAPKGFLHGFMTLEPDTIVSYKVTDFYNAASDGAVHWASPGLKLAWPAGADKAVLSDKDAAAPDFKDFKSPF